MPAMDMAYSIADPKILAGLKAGDSVQGKPKAESGNYTITSLAKRWQRIHASLSVQAAERTKAWTPAGT
jgi:Copper binding periplasmic protein CusF